MEDRTNPGIHTSSARREKKAKTLEGYSVCRIVARQRQGDELLGIVVVNPSGLTDVVLLYMVLVSSSRLGATMLGLVVPLAVHSLWKLLKVGPAPLSLRGTE